MSDKTTDTFIQMMEASFNAAPSAPDLPVASPHSPVLRRPAFALASGFAAVLLLVGVGAAIVAFNGDRQSGDVAATTTDAPIGFDTSTLGAELTALTGTTVTELDEVSLVNDVQEHINAGYDLDGPPVFVGRVAEIEGFIALFRHDSEPDLSCQIRVVNGQSRGNAMACGPETDSHFGVLFSSSGGVTDEESRAISTWVISTWDPDIAVISLQYPGGEKYWQRTYNGGVLMVPPTQTDIGGVSITAYSATGVVIGVENG
jgi:hypothetical protein